MYTTIAINIYVTYLQIIWKQSHIIMTHLLELLLDISTDYWSLKTQVQHFVETLKVLKV